eukprot:1259260-Alexandrium_andersonii.AAC.1
MSASLVGSEMCIRDRREGQRRRPAVSAQLLLGPRDCASPERCGGEGLRRRGVAPATCRRQQASSSNP